MYTKIVQSGNLVEIYEYEYSPAPKRPPKRRERRFRRYTRRIDNMGASKRRFGRLVRANLFGDNPSFCTLTFRDIVSLDVCNKHFTLFGMRLRSAFGDRLRYIAVPEFQRRGAVHYHLLIWGLPKGLACLASNEYYEDSTGQRHRKHICDEARQCERRTRRIATKWGHGFVDIFETDGSARLAGYLAKYMSKASMDGRLLGKKGYFTSRNVYKVTSLNTPVAIDTAKAVWGIDTSDESSLEPLREMSYTTKWLGRANYKSYNVIQKYEP
jgi:hypothetical protein